MTSRILLRRGTAAQWASANPILGSGELGVETDTLKFKIGNGTSTWTQLTSYANITPSDLTSAINGLINAAPSALDTLNELAAAINNDSSFSTTVNNLLNGKVSKSGGDTITASTASTVGLIIKAATSQTADIQRWQDSGGNTIAKIGPLYGSNVFQFDPFSYGAGSGYSQIVIGGRSIVNEQRAAQSKFGVTTGEWSLGSLRATDNQVGAFAVSTTLPTFVVKSAASQTANLQEWHNSAGTVLASINQYGGASFVQGGVAITGGSSLLVSNDIYSVYGKIVTGYGVNSPLGQFTSVASTSSTIPIVVRGATSQTANLQEWQDNAGSIVAKIGPTGATLLSASNYQYAYPTVTIGDAGYGFSAEGAALRYYTSGGSNGSHIWYGSSDNSVTRMVLSNNGTLGLKGISGQTANLQEWQNSAGTVLAKVDKDGNFNNQSSYSGILTTSVAATGGNISTTYGFYNNLSPTTDAGIAVMPWAANIRGAIIRGFAGQTANLQEWQNSSGTADTSINSTGRLSVRTTLADAALNVGAPSAATVNLIIRGAASQTANLTQWQDSSGSVLSRVQADGTFVWGSASSALQNSSGRLIINLGSAASVGITVKGAASQTANLQEWQNSSGTVLASVNASGGVSIGPAVSGITSGQLRTSSDTGSNYVDTTANDNGFIGPGITGRRQRGTIASPTAVQSNDLLYGFFGQGWNSSASFNPNAAAMRFIASQDLTSTANGAQIVLETTANNTTVRTERIRITNGGLFLIGSTTETLGSGGVASQLGVVATSATTVGAVIRGAASQTANLQEWQNSAGSSIASINTSGGIVATQARINTSSFLGYVSIVSTAPANIGAVIRGAASQTANLQEWQDSTGANLALMTSGGFLHGTGFRIKQNANSTISSAQGSIEIQGSTVRGLVIVAAASQTADLQQWQNSAGTVLAKVDASGIGTFAQGSFAGGAAIIDGGGGATLSAIYTGALKNSATAYNFFSNVTGSPYATVVVKGLSGQTTNLQEWQDSSGTVKSAINASGSLELNGKDIEIMNIMGAF